MPLDPFNPESPENIASAHEFATGLHQGLTLITKLLLDYHKMFEGVLAIEGSERERAFRYLFSRMVAWMQSLELLNSPIHFQAIATGNRALLEILVDIIFLHKSVGEDCAEKMVAHHDSQRLKVCEAMVDFYTKTKRVAVPDRYRYGAEFAKSARSRIQGLRLKYWPSKDGKVGTVPPRWTGEKLNTDVKAAELLFGRDFPVGINSSLREFYDVQYGQLNWHIHSGLASVWNQPAESFSIVAAFAMYAATDLAFHSAQILLKEFRFLDATDAFSAQWTAINELRQQFQAKSLGLIDSVDGNQ